MKALYLDIEVLRSPTKPVIDASSLEPPERYTNIRADPSKLLEWQAKEARKLEHSEWEKSSLNPMAGTICCVGMRPAGGETVCVPTVPGFVGEHEHPQLRWEANCLDLTGRIIRNEWDMNGQIVLTTWNGEEYDIPFLLKRALFHKRYELVSMLRRLPKVDLRRTWAMGKWHRNEPGKCDEVARFLGWEGPDDVDGSRVHGMFAMGDYEGVRRHCIIDIDKLAHIGGVLSMCGFWTEAT